MADENLPGTTVPEEEEKKVVHHSFLVGAKAMVMTGQLNILTLCSIVAFISQGMKLNEGVTFIFALLAIAPFAERLGFVTEQLALHTNESMGGLLNATFGNATELIVAVSALANGLYRLVQLSLLGSILSNILLVLGTAFWVGGSYHKTLTFRTVSAQVNCTLLCLGSMAVLFPTILTWSHSETFTGEVVVSRISALVLFSLYLAFLYFQIVTHPDAFEELSASDGDAAVDTEAALAADGAGGGAAASSDVAMAAMLRRMSAMERQLRSLTGSGGGPTRASLIKPTPAGDNSKGSTVAIMDMELSEVEDPESGRVQGSTGKEEDKDAGSTERLMPAGAQSDAQPAIGDGEGAGKTAKAGGKGAEEEEKEEEEDILGFWYALLWLAVITVFISFLSDALVESINSAAASSGASGIFLSTIVIPIVGNAAEHASSIMAAAKDKCDLALGIAVGSSTQICLCVLPLLVIIGWFIDKPLTMNFQPFEAFTLVLSIIMLAYTISHGSATWIMGTALFSAYVVIAVGFWVHDDEPLEKNG